MDRKGLEVSIHGRHARGIQPAHGRWHTRELLQWHEVDYAEKTLGVFVSMDGNKNTEKQYLRAESVNFADQMKTSEANKNDCMYTYTASFMKTMEYPMAVT